MRVCPKCGDYSADDLLAFCLADGTPLVEVDPKGENGPKAARVIEEKRKHLRKQNWSARWKLALMMALTMLVGAVLLSRSFTVETTPPRVALVSTSPTMTPTPFPSQSPSPSPLPSPSPSPSPSDSAPTPVPRCTEAGNNREKELILAKFGPKWRQLPVADQGKLTKQHNIIGTPPPEVTLTSVRIETRVTNLCTASVSARYLWSIYKAGNPTRLPQKQAAETSRQFSCSKTGASWHCR